MLQPSRQLSVFCLTVVIGCYSSAPAAFPLGQQSAEATAIRAYGPYTAADIQFMQSMIAHHAQAVRMAELTFTKTVRPEIQTLAQRISVGQRDEITFMQRWLGTRGETVPSPDARMIGSSMGMVSTSSRMARMRVTMPGMLTTAQMNELEAATGRQFERLFLTFMIHHHEGALIMVNQLFASPGAGQEVYVFRFASDVTADQMIEIQRMRRLLVQLGQ